MKSRYHFVKNFSDNEVDFGSINLIQVGRRFCSREEVIPAHTHKDYYELTVVTAGEGVVISNGESFKVSSGDLHLSIPCDIHEIIATSSSELEYDFLSFTCNDEKLKQELKKISNSLIKLKSRVFTDNKITTLISNVISEFSTQKPFTEKLVENIVTQIIIYLIRDFNNISKDKIKLSQTEILCYQIMNYIDTHVYTIQNLEDIAPKFSYNYRYLTTLFKKTTGKTLNEYFQGRKLETAKVLISENKYKILEISSMLNYSSPFAFSKAFKNKFGYSPKFEQQKNA